jgi:type I restriction enzyme S subunit
MSELSKIPRGWSSSSFGEVAKYYNGRCFKSSEWEEQGLPIIRIQNLNKHDASFNYTRQVFEEQYRVRNDDLLFSWSASLDVYIWKRGDAWLNQHIFRVEPHAGIEKRYLYYSLQNHLSDLRAQTHGAGMVHITKKKFEETPILLPPANEQKRIVAKIEELFSELESGIESLKTAREQLKVYRQAVLKHAFEGKLTATWREKNKDKLESADQLLARIEKAREIDYKKKLENWKKGLADKPKKIHTTSTFSAQELADLSVLPKSWQWVRWEDILDFDAGGFKRGPFGSALKKEFFVKHSKYKVYEQYCPINDDCSFERYYITEEKFKELEGFAVKAHDFLISCSGVTLGRITQVPEEFKEGIINQALLRVRLNKDAYDFAFFKQLFRSRYFQKRIFENSTGTAIPNVKGVGELKAIAVPLCSLAEQRQVIQEIEQCFSVIDKMQSDVDENLQKSEALRQSILKKAFSGQLVAQNPADEPASLLLERIRNEKATAKPTTKKPKEKSKAA